MLTPEDNNLQNAFKDPFDSFLTNENNNVSERINNLLETAKFAAVQTDIATQFEIANGLTNYATVNTSEPIPTQVSYNIGTENIENGKDGETLNNTEMQLEESSLITEFENQGVDLYDLSQSNVTSFDIAMLDPEPPLYNSKITSNESSNVKIINVQNVTPQESVGNDVTKNLDSVDLFSSLGLSTQWDDNLMNSFDASLEPDVPLNVQQPFYFENNDINGLMNQTTSLAQNSMFDQEKAPNADANLLKTLTAEADICKCVDCKCTPNNNCHGCNQGSPISPPEAITGKSERQSCCNGGCGKSKPKLTKCQAAIVEQVQKCCDETGDEENNNKDGDPCCVVVCLKTIKQLKEIVEMATHFAERNAVGEFGGAREATVTSAP